MRSSANRAVHGLNSVRLLLATEDVAEYRDHLDEWVRSLGPATPAEHQIVQLVADLVWRLKRVERIEQRRALAILGDLVEQTPELKTRSQAGDVVLGLETVARMVSTSAVPVPTTVIRGFLEGVGGVGQLLERLRASLPSELWPEAEICNYLGAVAKLAKEADAESSVSTTFTAVGAAASKLAGAVRSLTPGLDAAVEKARTAIPTETLLVDDEDRRFERHRRILEASVARQLDLLTKVRAVAKPSVSGSYERAPQVELRVVRA